VFLSAVFENPAWAQWILDEITGGSYPATLVFPHFRSQLEKHRNESIKTAINAIVPALQENNPVSAGIEDYQKALTRQVSDAPTTGAAIYETHCARCHSFKGRGTAIGPALETVSAHDPLKILTNIIHPNADIQPGYHVYSCSLKDGSTHQGILISENASSITMKASDNSETRILRQDIDSIVNTGLSLMPEGLDSLISPDEMASLIQFLRNP
jgi:putative heme-binding domain-containing protein